MSLPRPGARAPSTGAAGAVPGAAHGPASVQVSVPAAPPVTGERAHLQAAVAATLDRGIHGLCFSPYLPGQRPGDRVDEAQIRERLALVRPHTRWIRTFSCTDGHERTPAIAKAMGLRTMVGAWLGVDEAVNAREIAGLVAVAKAGHADVVAVGNEVLLREDLPEETLIDHLRATKAALPGVPVGYVDAYFLFEQHPRVTELCDVVMANCYPFWEGCAIDGALAYLQALYARARAAAPGRRVVISETGWPDRGCAFEAAEPGPEAAMRYFTETAAWAEANGVEWFHFAAFDEAWKVGAEGDVGACWGLWDEDARPKFVPSGRERP